MSSSTSARSVPRDLSRRVGRRARRLMRRWLALCRVSLLGAFFLGVTALLGLRSAEARLGRSLDAVLGQLAVWPGGTLHSAERLVVVNGLEVKVVSSTVDLSLDDTLEAATRRCRSMTGFDPTQLARADAADADTNALGAVFDGVIRWQGGDRGVVACLDTGGPLTLEELVSRVEAYKVSYDLSDIGHLRFAQAHAAEGHTAVLWIWTEGRVSLESLFPAKGDAPGFDPVGFEKLRPHGTRRVFSAAELGKPNAVSIYRCSSLSAAQARAELQQLGKLAGFLVEPRGDGLVVGYGAGQLLIDVAVSKKGGATLRVAQLAPI